MITKILLDVYFTNKLRRRSNRNGSTLDWLKLSILKFCKKRSSLVSMRKSCLHLIEPDLSDKQHKTYLRFESQKPMLKPHPSSTTKSIWTRSDCTVLLVNCAPVSTVCDFLRTMRMFLFLTNVNGAGNWVFLSKIPEEATKVFSPFFLLNKIT